MLPEPDYDVFLQALKDNLKKRNLQPVPWYIEKIIQVSTTSAELLVTGGCNELNNPCVMHRLIFSFLEWNADK